MQLLRRGSLTRSEAGRLIYVEYPSRRVIWLVLLITVCSALDALLTDAIRVDTGDIEDQRVARDQENLDLVDPTASQREQSLRRRALLTGHH